MTMRVDVVADADDKDPGLVGERLRDMHRGELLFRDRDELRLGDASDADLLLLLGSARTALAPDQSMIVGAEAELVRSALDSGVPVIGICYGAQLLAHALGGEVVAADHAEIGWYTHSSMDPILCPPGPWTQFHSDAFVPPPLARVLGTSSAGCQGFADDSRTTRALGWQFHPEVTAKRFVTWVERLRTYCEFHGADPDRLIAAAREREVALRESAFALTDAAITWVQTPNRTIRSPRPGDPARQGLQPRSAPSPRGERQVDAALPLRPESRPERLAGGSGRPLIGQSSAGRVPGPAAPLTNNRPSTAT